MTRRAWGEGSYDYNEKLDRWRWRGYYTINGESKRKEIVSKSRKELRSKVAKFLAEIKQSGTDVFSNITVDKWCTTWLNDIIKQSTKVRTYENYSSTCKNHIIPNFGKIKLKDLKPMAIQQFVNNLCQTHSVASVLTIRNHLIILLNAAIDYGYIKTNVAKLTKPPKRIKNEVMPLSDEQIKKLLDVAKEGSYIYYGAKQNWKENEGMLYLRHCYYTAVLLALTTGMRQGEIFGLKWDNINLDSKVIRVVTTMVTSKQHGGETLGTPKTKKSQRNILLPQITVDTLSAWLTYQQQYAYKWGNIFININNLVFTNSYGKMVSITNFTKRYFRKMLRSAGISDEVVFHTMRHSHATQLLKNGVNVKVVSERLGHSSASVTMDIYAHALPDMQRIAVDELEKIYQKTGGKEMKASLKMKLREYNALHQKKAVYFWFDILNEENEFLHLTNDNKSTYDFLIELLNQFQFENPVAEFDKTAFVLIKNNKMEIEVSFDCIDIKNQYYGHVILTSIN